jgi:flagellar hook protein FlgE
VIAFNAASGQVSTVTIPSGGTGTSTTNSDGSISLGVGAMPAGFTFPSGDTWSFKLPVPNSTDAMTQFAGQSTVAIQNQNGYASGTLDSYAIGTDGTLTGSFSNGTTLALGRIAVANFSNPSGLIDQGGGAFVTTPNSGQAQIGTANTGGRGSLLGGQLEQSNVSLDKELTNLIQAQVAYDANTKPLSTEQQVLGALEQLP